MVKIAIPVSKDVLSDRFGNCSHYEIVEIEKNKIIRRNQAIPPTMMASDIEKWIEEQGITDIIVHDMDTSSMRYFAETKINLFIGIHQVTPDELIHEYVRGTLKSNAQNIIL